MMNNSGALAITGIVTRGYGIASGSHGTLQKQWPAFLEAHIPVDEYYQGTINVLFSNVRLLRNCPTYTISNFKWDSTRAPESFAFFRCYIRFNTKGYIGCLEYYPIPVDERQLRRRENMIELICPFISEIIYGSEVDILLPDVCYVVS